MRRCEAQRLARTGGWRGPWRTVGCGEAAAIHRLGRWWCLAHAPVRDPRGPFGVVTPALAAKLRRVPREPEAAR